VSSCLCQTNSPLTFTMRMSWSLNPRDDLRMPVLLEEPEFVEQVDPLAHCVPQVEGILCTLQRRLCRFNALRGERLEAHPSCPRSISWDTSRLPTAPLAPPMNALMVVLLSSHPRDVAGLPV
jgi:hypothetical protein